jgi:hypothetical protein
MVLTGFYRALLWPLWGLPYLRRYPGLAPWAAFLRRFPALDELFPNLTWSQTKSRPELE